MKYDKPIFTFLILGSEMDLISLTKKVPNRRTLYAKIKRVYDLPKFSPTVSAEYLKKILTNEPNLLKVKREETFHVPKEECKRFRSKELFLMLEATLQEKGRNPTGFSERNIPDIA